MSTLAAARADNFYYPKDWDPSKGSLNKYRKSHPLGARAKKIKEGVLTIRFEVPFHVRCRKCNNMIGKGVRFNAEKKSVGMYHTTKIWEFSMGCHLCGNRIVVRTDPENTDYIFTQGAYKILSTENATDVEFMRDAEEIKKVREDPFARLENEVKDVTTAEQEKPRLHKLMELKEERRDDYALNSALRKKFRTEKKIIEKQESTKDEYKNFSVDLLDRSIDDKAAAKKRKFKQDPFKQNRDEKRAKIRSESIFGSRVDEQYNLKLKMSRLPEETKKVIQAQPTGKVSVLASKLAKLKEKLN